MVRLLNWLHQSGFSVEFTICIWLFLVPLRKRNHVILRGILASFAVIVGETLLYLLVTDILHVHVSVSFYLGFLIAIWAFYFVADLNLPDALFGACCAFAMQHMSHCIYSILTTFYPMGDMMGDIVVKVILLAVCVPCYFGFAKRLPIHGTYQVKVSEAIRSWCIIVPFAFCMSMIVELYYQENPVATLLFVMCRIYAILCCFFVLWIQTSMNEKVAAEVELNTQQMLFRKQKEQFELSRDNIDLINRKCHDLKHQIAAIRTMSSDKQRNQSLDEIEDSVMIYDSVVKTGNVALDTILTERSLYCEKEKIEWTCMADGSCLDFVDPIDLYTLLGNALDNAIEAIDQLQDADQKVLSLNIYNRAKLVVIEVQNYYQNEIQMEDGKLVTSKEDTGYHGIGIHSIEYTAKKYHGSVSISTENHIFNLCVLLPIPE